MPISKENVLDNEIVKIVIQSHSGHWEPHYSAKLSVTVNSIKYEYQELPTLTQLNGVI